MSCELVHTHWIIFCLRGRWTSADLPSSGGQLQGCGWWCLAPRPETGHGVSVGWGQRNWADLKKWRVRSQKKKKIEKKKKDQTLTFNLIWDSKAQDQWAESVRGAGRRAMRRKDCEVTEGLRSSKEMAACPQAAGRAEHKCIRTADDNTVSNAKIIHVRLLPVKSERRALLCPVACRILVQWDETSNGSDWSWEVSRHAPENKMQKQWNSFWSFQLVTPFQPEHQPAVHLFCPERRLIMPPPPVLDFSPPNPKLQIQQALNMTSRETSVARSCFCLHCSSATSGARLPGSESCRCWEGNAECKFCVHGNKD